MALEYRSLIKPIAYCAHILTLKSQQTWTLQNLAKVAEIYGGSSPPPQKNVARLKNRKVHNIPLKYKSIKNLLLFLNVACYGLLSIKNYGIFTALADQLRGGASLTFLSSLGL